MPFHERENGFAIPDLVFFAIDLGRFDPDPGSLKFSDQKSALHKLKYFVPKIDRIEKFKSKFWSIGRLSGKYLPVETGPRWSFWE